MCLAILPRNLIARMLYQMLNFIIVVQLAAHPRCSEKELFSESKMDALRYNKQTCDQLRVVYLNDLNSMQEKDAEYQLTQCYDSLEWRTE